MDAELTNRSRDALNAATTRAVSAGNPDLTPAHLLLALLEGQDNENLVDLLAAVEALKSSGVTPISCVARSRPPTVATTTTSRRS